MHLAAPLPASIGIDPDDVAHQYRARGLAWLTDEQLFDTAARVVSIPKQDPADSFVLHAPLELLARRALLGFAAPDRREAIRTQMIRVAARYERASDPAGAPREATFEGPAAALATLVDAIAARDLDMVDASAAWLAQHASTDGVMALADATAGSLAAAGHANIYFLLLGRHAWSSRSALALLRPLAREVARYPELRVEWVQEATPEGAADADAGPRFARALAAAPRLGLPGSDFVFPTVHQVDAGGQARAIVEPGLPADLAIATRAIQRVAAQSMLQDDPTYAPYGWTHCLTLSQAALGIRPWLRDARRAAAIAGTYVVAFRAAEGAHPIDADWEPAPVSETPRAALDADPRTAAAAAYHASDEALEPLVPELAARAGSHDDAHLAKYTLACLDAAATDPASRRLFLAAAAYLGAWWRASA